MQKKYLIPFNKPFMTGRELEYISKAHEEGHLAGDGVYTQLCHDWLETHCQVRKALLVHSCTAALEMSALLADIASGDEVIMPSYTFVSTANAFVLRGATPVFVDIREDTLNIDECLIEAAITARTKAIIVVHYAGVGCEMDAIMAIAAQHHLVVIEDAAQGVMARYKGKPLGSIGHMGALSFHETKNIISGEGGAFLSNDQALTERAEILREKGTNRSKFFRGQVDKYSWVDIGSSYLPSELVGAFLWAQMEQAQEITRRRLHLWSVYWEALADLEERGMLCLPHIPAGCEHNAHMFYILMPSLEQRAALIGHLRAVGIMAISHYVPLHSSPVGRRLARCHGDLKITENISERILRLPLWLGLEERQTDVIRQLRRFLESP
jgi:dTDP-4-amino-4,6-dideoxygalactose transaminase